MMELGLEPRQPGCTSQTSNHTVDFLPPKRVKDMLKAMVTGIVRARTRFSSSSYKLQPLVNWQPLL